ncbi:MAG: hypothetical protein HC802_13680 [Caldilineaceae bacterium]|nr:hypothetical protein [Caldilineaceae bacterium]
MSLGDWEPKLGIVTFYLGDTATARQILHDNLQRWLDKTNFFLARTYGYLAEIALSEGDLTQAGQAQAQWIRYQSKVRWLSTEVVDCLWVAARLAVVQQQYEQAATLFGLAEQVRRRVHYPGNGVMRPHIDDALATVQAALEPAVYAAAFVAGQQMTLEEVVAAKTVRFVAGQLVGA